MTEQTAGKVAQLTPEEWKNLVLLNAAQLQNFMQTIPGMSETGSSGLTPDHMALIEQHLERGRAFLRAWALAKYDLPKIKVAQPSAPATNGKGKGGWPKGKKRTRTPATPAAPEQ